MGLKSIHHGITPLPVFRANLRQMLFENAPSQQVSHHMLRECPAVQVCGLLGLNQLAVDGGWSNCVAEPQSRRENF